MDATRLTQLPGSGWAHQHATDGWPVRWWYVFGPQGARMHTLGQRASDALDTERKARTGDQMARQYLIEQLLQTRVERPEGPTEVTGEFVEPVQLQIVCRSLWDRLSEEQGVDEITVTHIDDYGQVDRALARYFGDVVTRVAAKAAANEFETRNWELEIRRWCEEELITPGGTRALVYSGTDATEGMPNSIIAALEAEHLIRGEERSGAHWYELSHDKFVGAIQSGNRQAFEEQWDSVLGDVRGVDRVHVRP